MDSNKNQIEEFGRIWHTYMRKSRLNKIEQKYPRVNGLTTIEISILSIVSKNPEVILREICADLDIPKSTLTSAIDRLEKRNYINRIISKRDKRSFGLELTEEGILAQKEHIEFENAIFARLLSGLDTEEERAQLIKSLKKIVTKFDDYTE